MSRPIVAVVALVVLLSTLAGVAGGAPGAGSAAAAVDADDAAAQVSTADRSLRSGETYWTGEVLAFDGSGVVPDDASESDRTFEIWRVADDGGLNQQVGTFTVAENGTHAIGTDGLVGRYVLRYGEQVVYVHDGVGYLRSPPDGSEVTVASSAFEFSRQTVEASWSDPSVYPGQGLSLSLGSNRDDYTVAVSADGLSFENLTAAFPESAYASGYDARANQSVLLISAGASTTLQLETAGLGPGEYTFEFDVLDAATTETARLTVNQPGDDGRFVSLERRENVGDVVEANLSCSHCFLVVGGPGQGILDVVELSDANGDGYVALRINTRYAGMTTSATGYPSGVEAYTSPDDDVSRYTSSAMLEAVDEELNYNVVTLDDLRGQQGLRSQGRARPLEPGRVDLTVTGSDFLIDRSAYGDREPLGSQLVVRDQSDVRTLTLDPRGLSAVETLAAPGGPRLPSTVGELRSATGPRDTVALGDFLVFRFDVSGVYGYLEATGVSVGTFQDAREEGLRLTLEEVSGQGPNSLSLEQSALRIYAHPETDSLYVAVQTGGTSRANLQAGQYRARLEISGVGDEYGAYSVSEAYVGYPYLPPGESESVSATASVEPPTAAIEAPEPGSAPHLNANGSLEVGGTTSLAPGGSVQLAATATEYSWETGATGTVNDTGYWTGALNLTQAPGDEFTVTVSHEGTQFDEETYTVRPPLENATDGGGSAGGSGGGSGQAGGAGPAGGILSGLGGLAGLAVPVGGAIGALVFVWLAWKLVVRRLLLS